MLFLPALSRGFIHLWSAGTTLAVAQLDCLAAVARAAVTSSISTEEIRSSDSLRDCVRQFVAAVIRQCGSNGSVVAALGRSATEMETRLPQLDPMHHAVYTSTAAGLRTAARGNDGGDGTRDSADAILFALPLASATTVEH